MAIERWDIDAVQSRVHFSVRHLMIARVEGRFARFTGTLLVDEADARETEVRATLEAASIDTAEAYRDRQLRSASFLDTERFPEIRFRSQQVEVEPRDGSYRLLGELTVRDVTRQVRLQVEERGRGRDAEGKERMTLSATTALDRAEFGLRWSALEAGGLLVGNRIDVAIKIEAVKSGSS